MKTIQRIVFAIIFLVLCTSLINFQIVQNWTKLNPSYVEWCKETPPNLLGHSKIDLQNPPLAWTDLEQKYQNVKFGGQYSPECQTDNKVAIIVPYRDRDVHLRYFLNHFHPFLQRQQLNYGIYVVEQLGQDLFNRGLLFNVGFEYIQKTSNYSWNCYIFHDVDHLPENDYNLYTCPKGNNNNRLWSKKFVCFDRELLSI